MTLLPSAEDGYMPYMLLLTSAMALLHSLVTYVYPISALKQFSGASAPEPTALTAHIYGAKNIYTSLIRLYTAYNMHTPELYNLALITYVGVFFLYGTEYLIWRTVRMRESALSFLISGGMII
ncbi:hypothetical protein BGW36DRAFT_405409 [Talaromyces proteolyticus]|uniref:Uncharacterized protein n=1 Tax=Talaromyces proteolyticus TaxID=1131652 RepID=A0AAD4Q280_9EURO|nr:uncharacterized protein BGW36DRAFT_405409 [Talaromyces proteolyticus]KAH8700101.1 hypothetical protein BGW36DRAFT_405409 [Talaromyces proteolyticus]